MTDPNETLKTALRSAEAKTATGRVPDFESVWAAAGAQAAAVRRRQRVLAGSAAVATAAVIAFGWLAPPEDEWRYVDAEGLLGTTSWSAPSDSLLPERQFDIYQEIPVLIESTGTNGGALL